MQKEYIYEIAEGLKLIEEGVTKIQDVMRDTKMKSLKEVAAELLPIFKEDDDSLSESIITHLE